MVAETVRAARAPVARHAERPRGRESARVGRARVTPPASARSSHGGSSRPTCCSVAVPGAAGSGTATSRRSTQAVRNRQERVRELFLSKQPTATSSSAGGRRERALQSRQLHADRERAHDPAVPAAPRNHAHSSSRSQSRRWSEARVPPWSATVSGCARRSSCDAMGRMRRSRGACGSPGQRSRAADRAAVRPGSARRHRDTLRQTEASRERARVHVEWYEAASEADVAVRGGHGHKLVTECLAATATTAASGGDARQVNP